jgi:hypothetical protein
MILNTYYVDKGVEFDALAKVGIKIWGFHGSDYEESETDSGHPDEGGAKFLRNVGSYKSHTA